MTCIFGVKTKISILYVKNDQIIFDLKNACRMTFSIL